MSPSDALRVRSLVDPRAASLVRRSCFIAIAKAMLGIGVGASAAAFTFVDALLTRPLDVREPANFVRPTNTRPDVSHRRVSAESALMDASACGWIPSAGVGVGLPLATVTGRSLESVLFGIPSANLGVLLAAGACLSVTSLFGTLSAALQTTRIRPMNALR